MHAGIQMHSRLCTLAYPGALNRVLQYLTKSHPVSMKKTIQSLSSPTGDGHLGIQMTVIELTRWGKLEVCPEPLFVESRPPGLKIFSSLSREACTTALMSLGALTCKLPLCFHRCTC